MSDFIPQMEPLFDGAEAKAVADYMSSGGFVTEFVKTREFEEQIAKFTGASHCIVTNNGTISLTLALLAAGIKHADEILVPDLTMIATANAGAIFGAKPVFVDVDPKTLCLDLLAGEKLITPKTKALIYVSLHGRSGDMVAVQDFCKKHNLFFLEDAAQSLGSYYEGKHLGRFGQVGSFSFSMPKIITTGQGGALITDDDDLAQAIRRLKDFGRAKGGTDTHDSIGYNFKFTDLQAVVGLEQIKALPQRMVRKREIYNLYRQKLQGVSQIEWLETSLSQTTPWFIDIYLDAPDALAAHLKEQGIGSRRIYPALHTQLAYQPSQHNCPKALQAAARGLWLPSAVQLSDAQIERITNAISQFF